MNKLFTKVAALTLGVAMAAGVGVALGSAKASEAKAADIVDSWDVSSFDNVPSSYATDGTEYSKTVSTSGVTYYATAINSNGGIRGNKSVNTQNFNLRNGTTYANYYVSKLVITTGNTGTMDPLTANRSKLIVGSTMFPKLSGTSVPAGTQISANETAAGSVLTFENSDTTVSYFMFYSLKTSGTCDSAHLEVTWSPIGDVPSTQYNVTDSVENGSVSPSKVNEGATLNATITPDTGYNVPETVSVTMGGVAATHTYENGVVTVENVTGDVEITGSCVAIPVTPEPDVVETTFADFIASTDADYAKAYHFSATIKAFKSGDTKDKYGNMTLTDGTSDLTVYGSTADATKLVWNGVSAKYEFTNPQDFMTTDLTNDSNIGDTVEVKFVRYYHSSKLNAQGIILSVTPGETPEIPEPEMVTGKKLSDLFADTAGNGKQLYEVTGVVSAWASGKSDATQYGNFYLKESLDSDTEYYIYGATADATKLVWGTASGVYGFSNPKDFLTNEVTKDVVIGSTLTMRLTRCDYNTTLEANGIVVSVVPPAPTAWTTEQEQTFKDNLDGYVPPYFAELSGEIEVYTTLVQYSVKSDVVAAFNSYYEQQGWESEVAGYWSHESTGGNGVVQAYAQTSATGALLSFQYTEYAVITLDENGTQTQVNVVPPFEYTLPSPTASLIPDGKEFKAWEIAGVEYQPEAKVSVSEDVTITAVYVDKVQTEWSDAQKAALETALHGYLPPFFGELVEDLSTTENGATFTVSGDQSGEFATKLGDGWDLVGTNNYMMTGDNYYLTASIEVFGVRGLPVGDYSTISFTYHEGSTWSAALLSQFATVLHGVVPSYDDSVSTLAYYANYKDFEMAATDQATAQAQLDTLCAGWTYYEAGGFYYMDTQDQLGYVRGYLYKESDTAYSATLVFVQTAYDEEQQDAFYDKLGIVPPFFSNFATYTFYETDGMFVTDQITYLDYLSDYQDEVTSYGFTLIGQSAGQRYVKVAGEAMDGTVYAYAAQLQDGGLLVVEIFTFYNYYLSINIYYQAMPVSIALSGEYKTTFEYGEQLDTEGMVVTATMSDETEQDVTSSAQFSGFDSLVEGEQTVTVTVGNASTTYTVTVNEKVLQSIAVTSEPTKVVYKVGEEFDPEGLEVSATYNGGDPVVLDLADVEISGFDSSTTGEKTVTVAFGGKTASFTVTVELAYDADAFAKDLLEMVAPICANYDGKKNNKVALKTVWDTMSQRYSTLSDEEKAKVIAAAAKTDGTDLEKAMAFYNYACKKYGLTKFIEGRQVKALVTEHETGNSILPIVVIVASSVAAITAIGVVIALKRRKALLAK